MAKACIQLDHLYTNVDKTVMAGDRVIGGYKTTFYLLLNQGDNMPRIFILDDDLGRQNQFARNLIGSDLVAVADSESARTVLEKGKFDVWFLDHDLGGQVFVPSDPDGNNGYAVAKWAAEMMKDKGMHVPELVVLHSLNLAGTANMEAVLLTVPGLNVLRKPFAWTEVHIKNGKVEIS